MPTCPRFQPRRTHSRARSALLAFVLTACAHTTPPQPSAPDGLEIMKAFDRATQRPLWPGFEPRSVPVALFDGRRTLLFRHPSPPTEFTPLAGAESVGVHPGRHPLVRANSSVELGGVHTATVVLEGATAALDPARLSGLIAHEAFHVFQRQHHPEWAGNEAELFTYPVFDAELLRLRRLEEEALRRALAETVADGSRCWAGVALELRNRRFGLMPEGASAYERGTELNEGLAQYIERAVAGAAARELLPPAGFPAAAIRERSYALGTALALLLDRFAPAWPGSLARGEHASLDGALADALAPSGNGECSFSAAEQASAGERAQRDVAEHRREQQETRERFLASPGWRVVIESDREPLWPQGFDPLNVRTQDGGEVLHARWLRLGNSAGAVEVLGRAALSQPAGEHPLFNGVRRLIVTGLPAEPLARDSAGITLLEAEGLTARGRGRLDREGSTLTLRLGAAP